MKGTGNARGQVSRNGVLHHAHGESFPSDTAAPPSRRLRVARTSPSSGSLVAAAVSTASMLIFYYLLTAVAGSVHEARPHILSSHFRLSTHPGPGAPPRPESKFRAEGGPSMRMRASSGPAPCSQEGQGLPGLRTPSIPSSSELPRNWNIGRDRNHCSTCSLL